MSRFDHTKYRPAPAVPLMQRQWPGRTITKAPRWASVDLRDGNQALLEQIERSVAGSREGNVQEWTAPPIGLGDGSSGHH